jgi:hypothetical protein
MKGTIRFMLGLLIMFGAAGADIATPNSHVIAAAAVGIMIMISGTNALKKEGKYDA